MLKDSSSHFGLISQLIHWIMAIIMIGLVAVGLYMTYLMPVGPDKFTLYGWHKQIGIVALVLVIFRLGWRAVNTRPHEIGSAKPWEKQAARWVHRFFYVAMVVMPLSGWLMSSAKGYPVSVFGYILPKLIEPSPTLGPVFALTHQITAYILIAGIILHVGGAFKHLWVYKDKTVQRMVPFLTRK